MARICNAADRPLRRARNRVLEFRWVYREQFKKQLAKRLENPHIPLARLSGADMKNAYKIKLRDVGYRLVYEVNDKTITVLVLAVGKRNRNEVYDVAKLRRQ